MTTNLFKLAVAGALVLAGAALPLVIHHHAQSHWRETEKAMRQWAVQLEQLTAENERLSNLRALAQTSPAVSDEALRELLRLRGEIGQLRQSAGEIQRLRAMNQRLLALLETPGGPSRDVPPDPKTVQAYWPKAQLAFAGYSEPAAGLKTALWAISLGDTQALAAALSPEALKTAAGREWGAPEGEFASSTPRISEWLAPCSGFCIVGQKLASADRAVFDVFFEGEGRTRKVALKKLGNEWKFEGLGRAGGSDEDLENGPIWP